MLECVSVHVCYLGDLQELSTVLSEIESLSGLRCADVS